MKRGGEDKHGAQSRTSDRADRKAFPSSEALKGHIKRWGHRDGRKEAQGSCPVQSHTPRPQRTVPGNDVDVDHRTPQLLEHLDH